MSKEKNDLVAKLGIKHPIFCGPMYPCSNPELVAAVSKTGAMGFVQPLSLTYVHGYDFKKGIQYIQSLTQNPIGMNVLIEASSKRYMDRMRLWLDEALELGVKAFITSLGKPDWVVKKAHAAGAVVLHDVTEKKWAQIAVDCGVDGLIAVNNQAGGHLGSHSPENLYSELSAFNLPLVCAGGVSTKKDYQEALALGYSAVQMGTRFIATQECSAHDAYKNALVKYGAKNIISSLKITGVPVSVLVDSVEKKKELSLNSLEKFLLSNAQTKKIIRLYYSLRSLLGMKRSSSKGGQYKGSWQAGKGVERIHSVLSVEELVDYLTK